MYEKKLFQINNLTKCGYIFKTTITADDYYLVLSCMQCDNVFWELATFLSHIKTHNIPKDELHAQEGSVFGIIKTFEEKSDKEMDPLGEVSYSYDNSKNIKTFIRNETTDVTIQELETANETVDSDKEINDNDFELKPHSCFDENLNDFNNDYMPNEYAEHCSKSVEDSNLNLKQLSKNRKFIASLIDAYKNQPQLWDTSKKTRNSKRKQEAYKNILYALNEEYQVSGSTTKQIEIIIKRLRLQFTHHYKSLHNDKEESSSLWFYNMLKFIEPHIEGVYKQKNISPPLSEENWLILINLYKKNECLWNEANIYHTSIMYRQETLEAMTNEFIVLSKLENISTIELKTFLEDLKAMAVNENKRLLKEEVTAGKTHTFPKFKEELNFLLPHVGPFVCCHCKKTYSDVYAYKFHVAQHEGNKPFKCMVCHKELTHKKEFMCHLRRHTKECPFQCEVCSKSFPSKKEWQRHIVKHGSKPYICELCADSFYTQHQLTNHMKNHANIRDHVCSECGKGFTHRGLLRQHLQTHSKTESQCTICSKVYANPRSLRKHYVRAHEIHEDNSTQTYNCKICMITFPTVKDAKQHRKEHRQSFPNKRHTCDICGNNFAYPRNLADHKKTHSNVRDQICDICGKAFTNANLLNQHKNVHNGQKFECKACGKDYAHYRGLYRHVVRAHGSNNKNPCAAIAKQKQEIQTE
uniref:Protein krueppel n=1 Tax=Stomoxys calcitrans TaxID=35570 RepID=A0A1I8PRQ1_STOCA|nr:unnamed protein product [Stomoxys calcitrans]